jgi:hypothetical protein
METIADVLIRRDDITREEAEDQVKCAKKWLKTLIDEGATLFEAEQFVEDEFALEPDYLMELL